MLLSKHAESEVRGVCSIRGPGMESAEGFQGVVPYLLEGVLQISVLPLHGGVHPGAVRTESE